MGCRPACRWPKRVTQCTREVNSGGFQTILLIADEKKTEFLALFKEFVSRDPQFVEKLEDIVGLYLSPEDACPGAVLRREKPSAGARPYPARIAAFEATRRHPDA